MYTKLPMSYKNYNALVRCNHFCTRFISEALTFSKVVTNRSDLTLSCCCINVCCENLLIYYTGQFGANCGSIPNQ